MAGFNSPNILFLNTYDAPDRKFIKELAPKLMANGYSKYVELYCGAFVMPLIVASAGCKPEDMYCYDISLFSNVLGYTFSGKDLKELDVRQNGAPIPLDGKDPVENAAIILYEQALARLAKAEGLEYFHYLLVDMRQNRQRHISAIEARIRHMDEVLHGLHFERLYIWDAFEKEKDDPNTFMVSNPPTYKGAYEKFFDTDGVITWVGDSISYEIWDGSVHCKKLLDMAEDCDALLLFLQQANKGKSASHDPVSARYLSVNQNVYWNTNKPDAVRAVQDDKELGAVGAKRRKSKYPILPADYEIKKGCRLTVFVEEGQIAEYYRRIWAHRITGKSVSFHLCVLIDGMIAGFIGMDIGPILRPYKETTNNTMIMSYAFPAPNNTARLARMLVAIAKSKKIILDAFSTSKQTNTVMYVTVADSICTVEYSKHQEVKGLRSLMKLKRKEKKADNLYALTYYADMNNDTPKKIIMDFIDNERRYKEKCQKMSQTEE